VLGGSVGVVPVECVRLLPKCLNVTQMAFWFRDRFSLGSSKNSDVVNSKEVSCQIDFSDWKIPKQKIEAIYQIAMFDFNATLLIKDDEETFSLEEEFQTIKLL